MKRLITVYAWLLLIVFFGVLIYTPLAVWLGVHIPKGSLWFKSWKELLLLLTAVIAVIIVSRRHLWRELFTDWLIRLIAAYVGLHLVLSVLLPHTTATLLAGLAIDLRYVLYFGLVYVLMKVAPEWRGRFVRAGAIGAAVVVGFAALETVLPKDLLAHIGYSRNTIVPYLTVDKNPNFIRFGSTLRGPNPLGAYAVIVLAAVAVLLARGKLALRRRAVLLATAAITICALVALWVSYSRSADIAAVAALVVVGGTKVSRRFLTRKSWLIISAVVLVCILGLASVWKSNFISNVVLHENPHGGSSVSSNAGHIQSILGGLHGLVTQPLGAGIGSTGSASLYGSSGTIIEDQYLFTAHEAGWLGLGLFLGLFSIVMVRLWRVRRDWLALLAFASGCGLAIVGFVLPVWADDTIGIVWWGLAALALRSTFDER